jgi:hypothetical protein
MLFGARAGSVVIGTTERHVGSLDLALPCLALPTCHLHPAKRQKLRRVDCKPRFHERNVHARREKVEGVQRIGAPSPTSESSPLPGRFGTA